MNGKRSFTLKFLLITLTVCCIGCSGGSDIDLGQVTGVVSMDGKPLPNAIIVFNPAKGNPSTGRTDANGKYELTYLGNKKGSILGSHKVSITTGAPVDSTLDDDADLSNSDLTDTKDISLQPADEMDASGQKSKKNKEPIPAKYNAKTELKGDVVAGENVINFDLKSK